MWLTGFPPLIATPVINFLLLAGVLFFTGTIINGSRQKSSAYKFLFLSVLAFSPALLEIYAMLWSETLFIFLSLLFFIAVRNYFNSYSIPSLVWMALIIATAFFTRYAGISLVITGSALLFFDGRLSVTKKIKHLLLFGSISCSFIAVNLIRNHHLSARLTGVREKALRSVGENISQVSDTIAGWLPFLDGHEKIAVAVFLLVFCAGVLLFFYKTIQQQYYHSYENIIACFFVVYILFLVTIASVSRFEDLSSRLLSPVYVPFFLVATSWIVPLSKRLTGIKKIILVFFSLVFFAGLQYHQYNLNAEAWEGIKDSGMPGYAEGSWKESATVQYIQQHKDSLSRSFLYSDAYDAVFFFSGLHAQALPHKEIQPEIDALLKHPDFAVIWINDGYNADLVDLDFIKQHKKLRSVTPLTDGGIYFFTDSTASKQ